MLSTLSPLPSSQSGLRRVHDRRRAGRHKPPGGARTQAAVVPPLGPPSDQRSDSQRHSPAPRTCGPRVPAAQAHGPSRGNPPITPSQGRRTGARSGPGSWRVSQSRVLSLAARTLHSDTLSLTAHPPTDVLSLTFVLIIVGGAKLGSEFNSLSRNTQSSPPQSLHDVRFRVTKQDSSQVRCKQMSPGDVPETTIFPTPACAPQIPLGELSPRQASLPGSGPYLGEPCSAGSGPCQFLLGPSPALGPAALPSSASSLLSASLLFLPGPPLACSSQDGMCRALSSHGLCCVTREPVTSHPISPPQAPPHSHEHLAQATLIFPHHCGHHARTLTWPTHDSCLLPRELLQAHALPPLVSIMSLEPGASRPAEHSR